MSDVSRATVERVHSHRNGNADVTVDGDETTLPAVVWIVTKDRDRNRISIFRLGFVTGENSGMRRSGANCAKNAAIRRRLNGARRLKLSEALTGYL